MRPHAATSFPLDRAKPDCLSIQPKESATKKESVLRQEALWKVSLPSSLLKSIKGIFFPAHDLLKTWKDFLIFAHSFPFPVKGFRKKPREKWKTRRVILKNPDRKPNLALFFQKKHRCFRFIAKVFRIFLSGKEQTDHEKWQNLPPFWRIRKGVEALKG